MTPAEFQRIVDAFEREEERREYVFQVIQNQDSFMVNVRQYEGGPAVAVVGGVLMPGGGVHPWVVTAANDKTFLPIEPYERARDLVRRLVVAIERAPEPVPVVRGSFTIEGPEGQTTAPCVGEFREAPEHPTDCYCDACLDDEPPSTIH